MDYAAYFKDVPVAITGGLGFIGSNLARRLVALGADVLLIDSMVPEYGGNLANVKDLGAGAQVNISDVRDPHSLSYLLQGRRILFNLAGQTSHMDSMSDPFTDLEINCRAQLSILEACRKRNPDIKIVFASTRQLYGVPERLPVDETHPLRPVDVNGINKLAGEQYHLLYQKVHGIQSCSLRLTNTIGPGMRIKDARQTFLGVWVRELLAGRPIEVWGGQQKRDFTDVEDVVDALVRCAAQPSAVGEIFNVGGMDVVDLKDLAARCVAACGFGEYVIKPFPEERKRIDIGDYFADDRKLRMATGWAPKVGIDESLRRIFEYYKANQEAYL